MVRFKWASVCDLTAANKTPAASPEIMEPSIEFPCNISTRKFGKCNFITFNLCVWSELHCKSELRIPYQTGELPIFDYVGLRFLSEKTIKSNTNISSPFYFS
jgi:hypothetical protein